MFVEEVLLGAGVIGGGRGGAMAVLEGVVAVLEAVVAIFGLEVLLEGLLEGLELVAVLFELLLAPELLLGLVGVLLVERAVEIVETVGLGLVEQALEVEVALVGGVERRGAGGRRLVAEGGVAGVVDDRDFCEVARVVQLELAAGVARLRRLQLLRLLLLRLLAQEVGVCGAVEGVRGGVIEVVEVEVEVLVLDLLHDVDEVAVAGGGLVGLEEVKRHGLNGDYNMRRRVIGLDEGLLAVLSDSGYAVTVVVGGAPVAVISSEERLLACHPLPAMRKAFMQHNRVVSHCYLLLVDRRLTWTLYRIRDTREQPELLYTGTLLSEHYDLARIVAVAEVAGKVLLLFERFRVLYLAFPEQDRPGLPIFSREFLPYGGEPEYEHAQLAVRSYLPSEEEHEALLYVYRQVSAEGGVLLAAYRSRANQLCSVYSLEYSNAKGYLLSGKNVLHNIEQTVCGVHPTALPHLFIIHTKHCLVLWSILQQAPESTFSRHEITLRSNMSAVVKEGEVVGYTAVTTSNKIVLLSVGKKGKLEVEELRMEAAGDLQLIEVQQANAKKGEYYCLTAQEELYLVGSSGRAKVVANEHTSISSSLLRLHPNYNFVLLEKERGQHRGKLIFGNHLFTYHADHYQHGLHLTSALLLAAETSAKQASVSLTSPLIGLQKLTVSLSASKQAEKQAKVRGENCFEVAVETPPKLAKNETLYLSSKYQITGEEVSEIGKKSVSVGKLFEDAADYVTAATVFSNELIVLSVSDQIHVFDSKFARKYIYCCSGEVKSLFALNDVNLLGVEVFESGRELAVLILEEDKARKMKTLPIPEEFDYLQLPTVINTAEFKLNLFGSIVVVCSNDPLHRFQLEKILVQDFPLPLPASALPRLSLMPVVAVGGERAGEFLVVLREEQPEGDSAMEEVEVYFASFSPKYLLKKFELAALTLSCERVLTLSQLPADKPLFAVLQQFEEGKPAALFRTLVVVGERFASVCSMKLGRVELEWLENAAYLAGELAKIESLPARVREACAQLPVPQPVNVLPTHKKDYFLVYNAREIYYTFCGARAEQVSYYSLINDDFTEFRNNLSVAELEDEQFMRAFNKKLVIRGVRFVSERAIMVLYDSAIVVLEVGVGNALTVRQELKFRAHQGDPLHIQEFLQNYDQHSLYLRDAHGRIYVLKETAAATYEILLHANMDDDVLLFSRVAGWNQRERTYCLGQRAEGERGFEEELVLKKDGQLSVKNLKAGTQDSKFIYL